ncbi:MAG: DUF3501 family protein [Nitrospiraceae bacterium]
MKPLLADELIEYAEYERQRDEFRRKIIALKQARRLAVGPQVTLLFENRETLQFQIQEMVRAERIVDPAKVQEELDVYNALLPGPGELSATLFIEITDSADIKRDLDAFQGIDRGPTVSLYVGAERAYGEFEGGRSNEVKISAVHFVRFAPSAAWLAVLADSASPAHVRIEHGAYRYEVAVPPALREQWRRDLASA